jgi:hypothetical protein
MSVPGLKSIEISLPPRIVFDRTWATPKTPLTASSSLRVTFTSMLVTSRSGTLATTAIRGNVTSG